MSSTSHVLINEKFGIVHNLLYLGLRLLMLDLIFDLALQMHTSCKYLFSMATLKFRKFNFAWRTCNWVLLFVGDNFNYYLVTILMEGLILMILFLCGRALFIP